MIEPAFNQTQVHAAIDMGFAEGLRALMRQDPDIIMVGEIRDLATAEMAIQAALTGHLVFSTLHTNDSASAITRLADLGVPPYLIAATVVGVLAQRLTRMLCPACKQRDESTTRETLDELSRPWRLSGGVRPYRAVGCLECRHTGYRGRVGLYELLLMTDAARSHVHPALDAAALSRQAVKDGMRPLRLAGAMKVAEGLTTMEEVMRSTPSIWHAARRGRRALGAASAPEPAARCRTERSNHVETTVTGVRRLPRMHPTASQGETNLEDQEREGLLVRLDVHRRRAGLCLGRHELQLRHVGAARARPSSRSAWACCWRCSVRWCCSRR